jgi:hypothetical protein
VSDPFDRTLIDPTPEERDATFAEAASWANAASPGQIVSWPPASFPRFLAELAQTPEGVRSWPHGRKYNYWDYAAQVAAAWWTDRLGRRHLRVLGGDGCSLHAALRLRRQIRGAVTHTTLEQVYPEHTAHLARGGPPRLLALCDCGAAGAPEALGWMGERCGPCHDRHAAGEAMPPRLRFSLPGNAAVEATFLPDGQALAVAQTDGGVSLRDLRTGAIEKLPWAVKQGEALACAGRRLVAVDNNRTLAIWDVRRRREVGRWSLSERAWECALSPAGDRLASTGTELGTVEVRSVKDGTLRRTITGALPEEPDTRVSCSVSGMAFSPDGRLLATASDGGPVRLWDVRSGRLVRKFADDLHPSCLAFSPDGALLAGASLLRGGVRVWEVAHEAAPPKAPTAGADAYNCIAFAPTGRALLAGGEDVLSVWDLAGGSARLDLSWVRASLLCLAWSPDGRWLAAGDNVGGVRIWAWEAIRALLAGPAKTP